MNPSRFLTAAAISMLLAGSAYAQTTTPNPDPVEPQPSDQNDLPSGDATSSDGAGAGQPATGAATASTPQEFATLAAQSDMFEIESSRIALEKAEDENVRSFAQEMIDDHTASSEAMKQAAQADGVNDIPTSLDAAHQQKITQLQETSADQFDGTYMQMQVQAHEQAVALFSGYAEQEGALADFAETTLPTLQEHLDHARELAR